jgi:glycerol kinase
MTRWILLLGQGTTSPRAMLFDDDDSRVAFAQRGPTQHFPQPGWVGQDRRAAGHGMGPQTASLEGEA